MAAKIRNHEGVIKIRKTVFGAVDETSEPIEVRPFVTDPARVRISRGYTVNLGNYESARVDISVEIPCYREEILNVMSQVQKEVEKQALDKAREIAEVVNSLESSFTGSSPLSSNPSSDEKTSIEELL